MHEESNEEEKMLAQAEKLLKLEEKKKIMSGTWFKPKFSPSQVMPIARESAGLLYPGKFNDVRYNLSHIQFQVLLFGGISNKLLQETWILHVPYYSSLKKESILTDNWRWELLDNDKIKDVVPEARYSFSLLLYEKDPT